MSADMPKTILITGAGTGIGRDAAFALAARGHRVIAATFNEAQAAALRAEMDPLGRNVQVALIEPGAIHTGFNQAMAASKYAWMDEKSYFSAQAAKMRAKETRVFGLIEARDTRSIVAKIVKASEVRRPRLRYVAPWVQGFFVRLARMAGV